MTKIGIIGNGSIASSIVAKLQDTELKIVETQEEINPILEENGTALIDQSMKLFKIAARPQLNFTDLQKLESVQVFIKENEIEPENASAVSATDQAAASPPQASSASDVASQILQGIKPPASEINPADKPL